MKNTENKLLRILFIGHDAGLTGAPVIALNLLKWFKKNKNVEVDIILKNGGILVEEYKKISNTYVWNESPQKDIISKIVRFLVKKLGLKQRKNCLHKIRRKKYDVIFVNSTASAEVAIAIRSVIDIPIVIRIPELDISIKQYCGVSVFLQFIPFINHIVAVSDAVRNNLIKNYSICPDKISKVYGCLPKLPFSDDGILTLKDLDIPENSFIVGLSGTMDWRKGFDLLPYLAYKLKQKEQNISFHFVWVGGNKMELACEKMLYDAQRLNVGEKIHIINETTNPEKYYVLFDVFVMLAREDPFPLVCLENAYLGKPIICFENSGGMPEFVSDDCGYVIPYLNIDMMAEKVLSLSENKEMISLLGNNGKNKILNKFNIENTAKEIFEILQLYANYEQ